MGMRKGLHIETCWAHCSITWRRALRHQLASQRMCSSQNSVWNLQEILRESSWKSRPALEGHCHGISLQSKFCLPLRLRVTLEQEFPCIHCRGRLCPSHHPLIALEVQATSASLTESPRPPNVDMPPAGKKRRTSATASRADQVSKVQAALATWALLQSS